jgi:hypothetical protein
MPMPELTTLPSLVFVGFFAVVLALLRISEHLNAIRKNLAFIKNVIEAWATSSTNDTSLSYLYDIKVSTEETEELLKDAVKKLDL